MKKLLSICFLSILLGLLSFSAQAQCGFVLKNLQPDTIFGVVQMAPDGKLPLEHTLGNGVFINPENPYDYYGNANVGQTELYELFLCGDCDIQAKTKVSLDWILQRQNENGEWVNVNDHLSDYVDFDIYTLYRELNDLGQCNRITWLGGRVPNGFGCCEQAVAPDMFHGITCNTPANYPGALPVGQGTPNSVMNQLGELIPAMGMTPIYTEALDYFYYDFFSQTRTLFQLNWKRAGNYRLIVNLRERVGGTAWNNLTWNENETTDFIGGHQSCCGEILKSDTLTYPVFREFSKEVCDNEHYFFGRPEYDFHVTMPDTNVAFGDVLNPNTGDCAVFDVDSIYRFHFFVRHTPQVVVKKATETLCKCSVFGEEQLLGMIAYDTLDFQYAADHKFMWQYEVGGVMGWHDEMPNIDTVVGVYTYTVRQVNTYMNYNQFYSEDLDTIVCSGEPVTLTVTIVEINPPVLPDNMDICLETIDSNYVLTLVSVPDEDCANTTKWYTDARYFIPGREDYPEDGYDEYLTAHIYKDSYKNTYIGTTNELSVNLINYIPSINKDTVLYFIATSYSEARDCESKTYSFMTVTIHQTPEIEKVAVPNAVNCPGSTVTMSVAISNDPDDTNPEYTFKWNGDVTTVGGEDFSENVVYTVGNTSKYNTPYPFSTESKYNYTQQIYENTEIGGAGEITKIAFGLYFGTVAKNNVKIYLGTTDQTTFNGTPLAWYPAGTLVYDGSVNFTTTGWNEIELQNSFVYDGSKNLIVTVEDQSGTIGNAAYFYVNDKNKSAMRDFGSKPLPSNAGPKTSDYRNSIKFYVENPGYATTEKSQSAQFQLPAECGASYMTTVYVIDGNGCVSQPDTFNYTGNDTEAPTLTIDNVNALTTVMDACHVTAPEAYTTVEELAEIGVVVDDNCAVNPEITYKDTLITTSCEDTIFRTYTVYDMCENATSFVQTFISHDSSAPYFEFAEGEFPYVRLFPVPAYHDCQYNSPDSMDFINAVAAHVRDNCTDSATLMQSVKFHWENTALPPVGESPIGATNIFRKKNHLTVAAVITDNCGNTADSLIIYLDKPDSIWIEEEITTLDPICQGDNTTLTFNPELIHGDEHLGLIEPLTYQWSVLNGKTATFGTPNALTTTVTPDGAGDFIFVLTVTDSNECSAVSGYYHLHVNAYPDVKIVATPHDGSVNPFCPTYGDVALQVVDKISNQVVSGLTYEWSGEDVNASTLATTTLSIQPSKCTHDYVANVHVTDPIGCDATATITIHVADNEAPVLADGSLKDSVLEYQSECALKVPDFAPFMEGNVTDNCFSYANGDITYEQTPAVGYVIKDEDWTNGYITVTVKLTDACDNFSTYTVKAIKPVNEPKLALQLSADSICENDEDYLAQGITITSTVTDGKAPFTYAWTQGISTTVIGEAANYLVTEPNGVYEYTLVVTDANGCQAEATVDVTIFYRGDDFPTREWANTLCQGYNGALAIDTVPYGYSFIFQENGIPVLKSQDVPAHETSPWNTVLYSPCAPGEWPLTIITPNGCSHDTLIYIPNDPKGTPAPVATPHDVTNCLDNNGWIEVTMQAGYTYYFIDGNDTTLITNATIEGLSASTYKIFRVDNATGCPSEAIPLTLGTTAEGPDFEIGNAVANTRCVAPANGSFDLLTPNLHYVVTLGDSTIYDATITAAHTIENLVDGDYHVAVTDPVTNCPNAGDITIVKNTNDPSVEGIASNNTYCDQELGADGSIAVTVGNNTTYTVVDIDGEEVGTTGLWQGTYYVNAVDNLGCTATDTVEVGFTPTYPTIKADSTMNMSCIAENANGTITITITNTPAGKTYRLWSLGEQGVWVGPVEQTTNVFTGLLAGEYQYQVVSTKGCESEIGTITVEQYQLEEMVLTSTDDYMCEPTNTVAGNGTITVTAPVASTGHTFTYTLGEVSNTTGVFTNLADGEYVVTAVETESGCTVEGETSVEHNIYVVTMDSTVTPNSHCAEPFNGAVTINFTTNNPNAQLTYKLDDGEFQTSNTFEALKDGHYTAVIYDANVNCYYELGIDIDRQENNLALTGVTTPNHGCTPDLYDGTLAVTATSTTWANPSYQFSFQHGDYATTSAWNQLGAGNYTVTVMEMNSHCTVEETFTVDPEGCLPIITDTAYNHNLNPAHWHFCLNTENAYLEFSATLPEGCENEGFAYNWSVDCHAQTGTGNIIPVATDEVHCCTYTMTVTSLATGCTSELPVYVCIDAIPAIQFQINHADFNDNPRVKEICVNEEVTVGVKPNSWEHAVWTNGYHSEVDPTYEFVVEPYATTPGVMKSFCVDVIDYNGCPNQGVISLLSKPLPVAEVYDTACTCVYLLNHAAYTPVRVEFCYDADLADANNHVHYQFNDTIFGGGVNGCDSVTIHYITLLGEPTVSGEVDNAFCAGTTIADVIADVVITNAIDTVIYLNGQEVELTDALAYHNCEIDQLEIIAFSGSYSEYGVMNFCNNHAYYNFVVNTAPKFNADLVLDEHYCADGEPRVLAIPAHSNNMCTNGATTMHLYVTNTANITDVYADLGEITAPEISFIPRNAYNGKKLAITITNSCGSDVKFADLVVDSTVIELTNVEYCEGTAISYDAMLPNHYDPANVTAYLITNNGAVAYTPNTPLTYAQNGTQIYFVVTAEICPYVVTDTVALNIYPKPTVTLQPNHDMCLADAASIMENSIVSENATVEGWINYNATPTFFEGFENITNPSGLPTGWSVYDNDGDGYNWTTVLLNDGNGSHFHSYEGQDAAGSASYINEIGALEPDNWLFTPALTLSGNNVLSFYVRGENDGFDNNEYYSVYVLPAAQVNTSATPVATGVTTDVYDHVVVDLSEYDGQTVYVAFRHHETTGQYWLVLDNVAVYPLISDAEDLVDAIQNEPSAQIGYFVANDCGTDLVDLTVRILKPLAITAQPVLVCPDATLADVVSAANVVTNINNYDPSEVEEVVYTVTVDGTEYMLNDNDDVIDYTLGYSDLTITATVQTVDGVESCGDASAPIVVSFKHSTFTDPTYQAACDGEPLSAFIATPLPSYTGNDPAQGHWEVLDGDALDYQAVDPDEYVVDWTTDPYVRYVWVTECGNTVTTTGTPLTINRAPEITHLVNELTACEGGTISESATNLEVVYHGNESLYTTTWTVDGEEFDFSTPMTMEYDGKELVVTIDDNDQACGSTEASLIINVNPNPNPTITGPAKACNGDNITFVAEPAGANYTYQFTINGNYDNMVVSGNEVSADVFADGVEFVTAQVTVTDENGCSGISETSLPVRVTDRPEFIFYNADGSENTAHYYEAETGNTASTVGLNYGWMINTNCAIEDKLVYVEFDYYYNGVKIADNNTIGQYLATQTQTDEHGNTNPFVTALTFSWLNGDQSPHQPNTSLYNFSIANPNVSTAGNHFPNTNLGLTNVNVYDDLWMHFIGDRKVDATIVPFRLNGEYKVVYRLYSTTHEDDFNHLYYEDSHHMEDNYYGQKLHLGGQNAFTGNPTLTLLISDSIIINVTGENMVPSTTPGEEMTVTPEVAPQLAMEDAAVVPDMEVWPNPAPAVTTTLKARVHNLNGDATVTLTTLTGKQVYNGKIFIDNDNYYFEFDVNSLSVGSYIMTVRTATDVITKKVIVTSLAR